MTLNFYTNNSSNKALDKNLTSVVSLSGNLREESSVINPSILIEYSGFIGANYAYIPEFQRYYFIKEITSVRKNLWRVDMHVDVLSSFKSAIRNNTAIIERAQGYYDLYLEDNMLPIEQSTFSTTYALGNDFSQSGVYMLASDSTGVPNT